VHFWLRSEVKPFEHRTILMPNHVAKLVEAGHTVTIEESDQRCVPIAEYKKIHGVKIAKPGDWQTLPPKSAVILGLKEIPEEDTPLTSDHVYFGHCYKNQDGWQHILNRFVRGGSVLWDLEFLNDAIGRRVAAFGRSAGIVGMAIGLLVWVHQQLAEAIPSYDSPFKDVKTMATHVENQFKRIPGKLPKVIVIGALGRCGTGAVDFAKMVGLTDANISKWDLEETKKGGPFKEVVVEHDIFINCIYLAANIKTPPFITKEAIQDSKRRLTVMVDVSCDPNNPNNPVPIYSSCTTFPKPATRIIENNKLPLDVIAIDHLPSLIPSESSMEFASALISHLETFPSTNVWEGARQIFEQKTGPLRK